MLDAHPDPIAEHIWTDIPMLTGIRTAAHSTFDRIVLDFSGPRPQVSFRFVDELGDLVSAHLDTAALVELLEHGAPPNLPFVPLGTTAH